MADGSVAKRQQAELKIAPQLNPGCARFAVKFLGLFNIFFAVSKDAISTDVVMECPKLERSPQVSVKITLKCYLLEFKRCRAINYAEWQID